MRSRRWAPAPGWDDGRRGARRRADRGIPRPDTVRLELFGLGSGWRLVERYGVAQTSGVLIDLDLSQEAIASLAGTTRESANRALSHLRERGIVLILAHLVGDFVLQNSWIVARKRTPRGLALHVGLVGLAMLPAVGGQLDRPGFFVTPSLPPVNTGNPGAMRAV